jgi:lysozyme
MANEQDIIPMVDVEKLGQWTRQELIDSLSLFMDMLTEHYGIQPMIYSQMSFYNDNLSPYFNKYPLYIARYSFRQPKIKWNGHYVLWQYTEKGVVPGVSSHVDLCRFSSDKWFDDIEMPSSSSQKSS